MALGNDTILASPASAFNQASGMDAAILAQIIAAVTVFLVLGWAAWYTLRVYATGFSKGDYKFLISGTVLAIFTVFIVTWIVSET